MAIGSLQKAGYYVSGSRFKKQFGTNAQRANRQAVQNQVSQIGIAAANVFGGGFSYSQGINDIILSKAATRMAAQTALSKLVNVRV